ncbi:MAG TPA: hypothetical protein VN845_12140 [Solirubrobacteraceae bacterium]|nr:hypothetical protein [Solirubrobacteraceae bacterium]
MTDFLDEKRREINDRLAELKPLIDEYNRLEAAATALAGVRGSAPRATAAAPAAATAAAPAKRGPGRPRGSKSRTTGARRGRPPKAAAASTATPAASTATAASPRRAGRRKGSGTRAAQALSFVTGQPGITIPELAAKMSIKQNYLYRVLPGLEQEKKIKKQGRGWHPA